jgi:hypothetical protein
MDHQNPGHVIIVHCRGNGVVKIVSAALCFAEAVVGDSIISTLSTVWKDGQVPTLPPLLYGRLDCGYILDITVNLALS